MLSDAVLSKFFLYNTHKAAIKSEYSVCYTVPMADVQIN